MPEHDCLEVMDEVFFSQPDLTDQPISHLDAENFTDDSSFAREGTCFARYTVVTLDAITETCLLLVGTSVQKAHIALMRTLQLTAGMWVNIYIDSKYAFISLMFMEPYIKKGGSLTQ
jgi:hypothetical protein